MLGWYIVQQLSALERALVDVTNKVGVDINCVVTDSYYQNLLPFICGLGPRKAQALARKIVLIICCCSCFFLF